MTDMQPTGEQRNALDAFATRGSLAIEAGAGTGKTTTLSLLARSTERTGQYIAFNKSIVEDSRAKFPRTVTANTAHSLAFRALGFRYGDRLRNGARMTGREVAARLGLNAIGVPDFEGKPKVLDAAFLASICSRGVIGFCQSADTEIAARHFPYIEGLDQGVNGKRTYETNNYVRGKLLPFARALWDDLQLTHGWVPYRHDHYLKAWQLSGPRINADYILFDEAQDANPVIAAIVAAQTQAQLVYVGDSQQEIFGWTGAVNALGKVDVEHRTYLSQSFRFGDAIAAVANGLLDQLDAAIRLRGNPAIQSTVGPLDMPSAILTRTNATAVEEVLNAQQDGDSTHLIGGGSEVTDFCRAAAELLAGRRTSHPDLAIFGSWADVQAYVRDDPEGGDLRLLVKLVDQFTPETIIAALNESVREDRADVVVSTTHKAKGREWSSVRLARDFAPKPGQPAVPAIEPNEDARAELRLRYVAVTRARLALDCSALTAPAEQQALPQAGPR